MSEARDPLEVAQEWLGAGRDVALATVIETWGSAPRKSGSHLVIDGEGNFEGSVSGGCVEGAVIHGALEVIESGKPQVMEFGVADETAWEVGLSCGGKIMVYLEKITNPSNLLSKILDLRKTRVACALITHIETGEQILWQQGLALDGALEAEFEAVLKRRKSQQVEVDTGRYFINLYLPEPRMVIIGAVHIAQALVKMAQLSDYEIVVIDPRTAFASVERFPDVTLYAEWPEDIWADVKLDAHTALVALTHDPKVDDWPLKQALDAECFYIGALGSRKTHGKRCERLKAAGANDADLAKIHAPIGLNIGAANPVEIAVAILAQIIESRRI